MRKCENCDYGHYCNDNLMCGYNEYFEEKTSSENVCKHHEYMNDLCEEKNYLLYDEAYLAPGYIVATKESWLLTRFFKIYTINSEGFPCFAIRAFDKYAIDKSEMTFNELKFTFRSREDEDNSLFDIFYKFALRLKNNRVNNIDDRNGKNGLSIDIDENVVTMTIYKDVYGIKNPTDFVEILLGDELTCEFYTEIASLYRNLGKRNKFKSASEDDIKELRMAKVINKNNK